ncbi:MAG: competence protein CoiA family protein [Gemmatimonadota bacterium]|nr:competence protein CoiA family protein [Gemmatimonadota bacterium]
MTRPLHTSDLAVPVAFAPDGSVVRPADAEPGTSYRCPGCSVEVVLRTGGRRRPHFAHRSGEGCSTESTLHRAAKRRILEVVDAWKHHGGPRPCIARPCPQPDCDGGIVQDLPTDVTHAAEEVRMPDGSVADLVLFRDEQPAAAIEILVTHRVDHAKAERLGMPWIEVRAAEVLERPYWWVAIQDRLRPFVCPKCTERDRTMHRAVVDVRARALVVAERLGVDLPPSPPYGYAPHTCWRCHREMLAFAWPGGGGHSPTRPPDPIPPTVQHRVTEGGGNYWANTCLHCAAVQGDYYLTRDNEAYMTVSTYMERQRGGDTSWTAIHKEP